MNCHQKKYDSGFTLLEILICLVVLAIGLLGLAGLQATGLKNNHSAYHRSQAIQLSYDIADRMRANAAGIASYTGAANPAVCNASPGCTPVQMAGQDLVEWNALIASVLPNGTGTITFDAPDYVITITWDDDRDGDNTNNPSFETRMQP